VSNEQQHQHEPLGLTVEEAARLLGISRSLAYQLVERRDLPAVRLGRRLVVPRRALERLMDVDGGSS
jgi:excisionase family DNA binding protein